MMLNQLARSRFRNLPENLFRSGEKGVYYDPSRFDTMFQDSSGTTPVTALGQPVGLILDLSQGLELGAELFANQSSTLDNSAGGATCSHNAASRSVTVSVAGASGNYPRLTVDLGLVTGKTYLVSGRIDGNRTGLSSPQVRLATVGTNNNLSYNSTTGEFFGRVVAAGSSLQILVDGTKTGTVTIATISARELKGNHAIQLTTTKRPKLEARVNLATNTGFSLGGVGSTPTGWIERGLVTGRVVASDSSSGYAMRVTGGGVTGGITSTDDIRLTISGWWAAGVSLTLKFKIRKAPGSGAGNAVFYFATTPTQAITLTDSWQEVSYTRTPSSTSKALFFGSSAPGVIYDVADVSVTLTSDASRPYQRVNSETDYTDIGAPRYLAFDGTDDFMQTQSIDFTGTDAMSVWAGIRKNSDAAQGMVVELSPSVVTNAGAFRLAAPAGVSASLSFAARGSATQIAEVATGYPSPRSSVLTGIADISSDSIVLRENSTQLASSSADLGTGNFGNYALNIGARAGTSGFFNGRLYGLIVAGKTASNDEIINNEQWMNSRMGRIY